MNKSVFITARIPPDLKHDHEWPWKLHILNTETRKVIVTSD